MIKRVSFHGWKSFRSADLFIDPMTVLIGANASGKSNAIDGLAVLNRIAGGMSLTGALTGEAALPPIRGGLEWAALKPESGPFTLEVLVAGSVERVDYRYSITMGITGNHCHLIAESLHRLKYRATGSPEPTGKPKEIELFKTDAVAENAPEIVGYLYNEKRGTPWMGSRTHALLFQLSGQKPGKEIADGLAEVTRALTGIFVLDPVPARMRGYVPISNRLDSDGGNIAGVIAGLPPGQKTELETVLTEYVRGLPEKDIRRIWAEPVGRFGSDAMLYCEEAWRENGMTTVVDTRGMSDGTLRLLAILAALATRPAGSLLVVEEIDTGLHPSRARLMTRMLKTIGGNQGVDVLATTHNPALLDALGPEIVPFVTVAHRDIYGGDSRLTLLEDLGQLPKMLASGPVGRLMTRGLIETALQSEKATSKRDAPGPDL